MIQLHSSHLFVESPSFGELEERILLKRLSLKQFVWNIVCPGLSNRACVNKHSLGTVFFLSFGLVDLVKANYILRSLPKKLCIDLVQICSIALNS